MEMIQGGGRAESADSTQGAAPDIYSANSNESIQQVRLLTDCDGRRKHRQLNIGWSDMGEIKWPVEFSNELREVILRIRSEGLTQVSLERLFATAMACTHVVKSGLDGDFVECGVWKGGNVILASWIFGNLGSKKKVYLYDTFSGMTEPTDVDRIAASGVSVRDWYERGKAKDHNTRNYVPIEEVKKNFEDFGLSQDCAVFVKGDVAETLKSDRVLPEKISVLRLDTDWYESTKIELDILYPRLVRGGVIMIDDYGYFEGARLAVDEYFQARGSRPLLQYIDYTGRIGVKCS